HVNNITSQETSALQSQTAYSQDVVTLYQNGTNAIQGFTADDVYLVIENDFLKPNSTLESLTKRIQVVNLSNITDMCTVSLTLNTLDRFIADGAYALHQNNKNKYVSFEDVAIVSFQSFHMIDKVQAHSMPLLLIPRSVYMAGSSIGSAYASYIQTYSQKLGNSNAGSDAVYYDLAMQYSCEPFEYLRLLGYFDVTNSVYPVIDQSMSVASGTTLGSYIFTDVLGSYVASAAQDLSWVVAQSNKSLSSKQEHLVISFTPSVQENTKTAIGGLFGKLYQQHVGSTTSTSAAIPMSSDSSDNFPITQISQNLLCPNSTFTLDFFDGNGKFTGLTCDWFVGVPYWFKAGTGYDKPSSLQSWWWKMDKELWTRGVKLVPVYYDVTTCSPFVIESSFDVINANKRSILYFYAYRPSSQSYAKEEFLGLVPVLFQFGSEMQLDVATKWVTVARRSITEWGVTAAMQASVFNKYSYQSSEYDDGAVAFPGQQNLINKGTCSFEYPGFGYLAVNSVQSGDYMYTVQNKMKDFSDLVTLINATWSIPNPQSYSWTIAVPKADMSKGVNVRAEKVHKNTYHVTVRDKDDTILYAQRMYVDGPQDNNLVVAALKSNDTLSTYAMMPISGRVKDVMVSLQDSELVMKDVVGSKKVTSKKVQSRATKTTKKVVAKQ
nr:hypothetical protein [Candidatus Babeliales bacterium]